jgi:hypothetical protein
MSIRKNYVFHRTKVDFKFSPKQVEQTITFLEDTLDEIFEYEEMDEIKFFDCGENADSIVCDLCNSELDYEHWGEAMSLAHEKKFADFSFKTDCCKITTSLNTLIYKSEQGFAKNYFGCDDSFGWLEPSELAELESIIGEKLKFVHAQY